jgi:hypothetical protein
MTRSDRRTPERRWSWVSEREDAAGASLARADRLVRLPPTVPRQMKLTGRLPAKRFAQGQLGP